MSLSHPLLALKGVSFRRPHVDPVLNDIDLAVHPGERIGLMGAIGSGKTTLLHLIVGLLSPQEGRIEVFGRIRREEQHFWEVRERVGLLFQDSDDQLFCSTVSEDVAFGPLNQGKGREDVHQAVHRALDMVGMAGLEGRVTHHLSGGEKRLVSLATLLAMEPDMLLLDEPENGLDPASYDRLCQLLLSLPQAMIIVSHSETFLRDVTTRRVAIADGMLTTLQ
jgi:cobalt/nickel transport system ATP-binding protein